jgi:hypothetical protein
MVFPSVVHIFGEATDISNRTFSTASSKKSMGVKISPTFHIGLIGDGYLELLI